MINFHTPELPSPLGLDLATLEGGGACPSQFFGKTHNELDVYVRYRGGTLKIYVSKEPGDDVLNDDNCIIETDVGPPLDGRISLTQFCTNFGVTINGIIPDETDTDAHRYTNLNGHTTFWDVYLRQITIATARKIVSNAFSILPDALLVKPILSNKFRLNSLEQITPDHIDVSSIWLIDGPSRLTEIDISPDGYILPHSDQLQISIHYSSWEYPAPKYTNLLRETKDHPGQTFFVPGERGMPKEIELTTDSLSLSASFHTKDKVMRDKLTRLGEMISQHLPETALECVELETGKVIESIHRPLDPVIANWCTGGANRWVHVTREDRNAPLIGVRTAKK